MYRYNTDGTILGFTNDTACHYVKNMQDDVRTIVDESKIQSSTNTAFEANFMCAVTGAFRFVLNGSINVFDAVKAGFK